jgi:hypothetical protein
MDGPGGETRWGRNFPPLSRTPLRPTQTPIQWVPGISRGGKAAGAWRWSPTPSSAKVKEKVELYLYSPSGTSWPVLGWPLPSEHTCSATKRKTTNPDVSGDIWPSYYVTPKRNPIRTPVLTTCIPHLNTVNALIQLAAPITGTSCSDRSAFGCVHIYI